MKVRHTLLLFLALIIISAAATPAAAQGRRTMGAVKPYQAESPHPYPLGAEERQAVWSDRIVVPGATFLRVHFSGLNLAPEDFISVASPDGSEVWTYTGRGPHGNGDVWSFAIEGDEAIVTIFGGRGQGFGYRIDAVAVGAVPLRSRPTPEVVCGIDAREDVACHTSNSSFDAAQKPVARLLFVSGGFLYACTGWLVDGSMPNMMVTNNHCFSTQRETDTVQATFNFQRSNCEGSSNSATTDYAGGTFLRTNNVDRRGSKEGLDYTLFTLLGNPASTWGELIPTNTAANVGRVFWFIQHGGGNEKKVGYYQDIVNDEGDRCKVAAVGQTYGRSAPGSQIAYACDSEGGSSGSPIVASDTNRVIALHHFGGVGNNPCLNSGTSMGDICADAGSLLNCQGDGSGSGGTCDLLPAGASCTLNSECCSGNCKGKPGSRTCK